MITNLGVKIDHNADFSADYIRDMVNTMLQVLYEYKNGIWSIEVRGTI